MKGTIMSGECNVCGQMGCVEAKHCPFMSDQSSCSGADAGEKQLDQAKVCARCSQPIEFIEYRNLVSVICGCFGTPSGAVRDVPATTSVLDDLLSWARTNRLFADRWSDKTRGNTQKVQACRAAVFFEVEMQIEQAIEKIQNKTKKPGLG